MSTMETIGLLEEIFEAMDGIFSESGERRRFILACQQLSESDLHLLQSALGGKAKAKEALEQVKHADSPLRIANALLNLEVKIQKSKDKDFLSFIFALLAATGVVKGLNRLWPLSWELALIKNRNLTQEQVRFVWANKKVAYCEELVPYSIRVLAKHPGCPVDVLEELLSHDDGMLRKIISQHQNISPVLTHFFLNSPRKTERLSVSLSRHVSGESLLSLLEDKYEEISRSARKNFSKRFPGIEITGAAIKEAIAKNIDKPHIKQQEPKEAFDPREDERKGLEEIASCKDSNHRKRIADSTWDQEVLRLLSKDTSKVVRRAVAKNFKCPIEILKDFAKDSDVETSNNALKQIFKREPELMAEDLLASEVIGRAHQTIVQYVKNRKKSSGKPSKQDELDKEQALLVASYTSNHMIQLQIVSDLEFIPDLWTDPWDFLSAVSENRNLCDAAVRKIAIELGFATTAVLGLCKKTEILSELLGQKNVPADVRRRVEEMIAERGFKG